MKSEAKDNGYNKFSKAIEDIKKFLQKKSKEDKWKSAVGFKNNFRAEA